MRGMQKRIVYWLAAALLSPASLLAAPTVVGRDDQHLGVASCAGNTCHGSTRPFKDSKIRQDEYFVWQRKDAHAQAWLTLTSERSEAIARRLGLGPAEQAQECLVCHAESASQRGPRYQVSDGIGCEACHGAAERWIEPHAKGFHSLDERLEAGLYPTWDVHARAKLCASCHSGDPQHPMTHAIMAAGHPPILFELDTFQALTPPHWQIDEDYVRRKGPQDPARNWIVGQVAASIALLENLAGPRLGHGIFPELAFFDCDACHHSMKAGRARAERSAGLALGNVPAADAPLVMLGRWLDVVEPSLGERWDDQLRQFHIAGSAGTEALQAQARAMLAELHQSVLPKTDATVPSESLRRLIGRIVADARQSHSGDYEHAQQTAMAVSVLTTALVERGHAEVSDAQRAAVDALYNQVQDRDRFSAGSYAAALDRLSGAFHASAPSGIAGSP
ncbi:MAG: hypothetical protein E6R07_13680 [Nevskiaceae bacterium]|nr:MAG: hypothetical protein E6R07_13680 [Nevskiaceae bacterium]